MVKSALVTRPLLHSAVILSGAWVFVHESPREVEKLALSEAEGIPASLGPGIGVPRVLWLMSLYTWSRTLPTDDRDFHPFTNSER